MADINQHARYEQNPQTVERMSDGRQVVDTTTGLIIDCGVPVFRCVRKGDKSSKRRGRAYGERKIGCFSLPQALESLKGRFNVKAARSREKPPLFLTLRHSHCFAQAVSWSSW